MDRVVIRSGIVDPCRNLFGYQSRKLPTELLSLTEYYFFLIYHLTELILENVGNNMINVCKQCCFYDPYVSY